MNPRALRSRPANSLIPTLLITVAALMFPCASAKAGCGSHDGRPTIPLEWTGISTPAGRPAPADRIPTCSGPSCSQRPASAPILPAPRSIPQLDLWVEEQDTTLPDRGPDRPARGRDELSPIGRITDVERPPCPHSRP